MKINSIGYPHYNISLTKKRTSLLAFGQKGRDLFVSSTKKEPKNSVLFVRMKTYKKDKDWADRMMATIDEASKMIKNDSNFEDIIAYIEQRIHEIRGDEYALRRTKYTMEGVFNIYSGKRGGEYYKKYKKLVVDKNSLIPNADDEYSNANRCKILYNQEYSAIQIIYGSAFNEPKNLAFAKSEYEKFKSIKNPTIKEINEACAKIYWLIIQECPYIRGNDSLAGTLVRAIYKSNNIELAPLKRKSSLDFEAFYRDLDEYVKCYPDFFKKNKRA